MYKRDCLSDGCFDKIPKDFIFEVDNNLYKEFRNNIHEFIQTTVPTNAVVLEIGPKDFKATPSIVNDSNVVETVDIVQNMSTTYVCDLTSDKVSIPQNRFDVIYCLEVIEHCSNPSKLLTTISTLLKPNGKICISFPFQFRLHGPIPDNWRISEYGFKQLCSDSGLSIDKLEALIEPSRPAFPLHYTAICSKKNNIRQTTTFIPVSFGEAIDKLTILDIKVNKIANETKKQECKKEYDALYSHLKQNVEEYTFLYNCLRYINLKIWEDQDIFRVNPSFDNRLAQRVLDMNDMRFRIKKKINDLSFSTLNEQKGYAEKVGLFVTHLGLGDLINMNGAIRYCATMVDKLFVVSKKRNAINIRDMLNDDKSIEIFECNDDDDDSDVGYIIAAETIHGHKITNRFLSGCWNSQIDYSDLPDCFYKNMNIPTEVKKLFFKCDRTGQLSLPDQPYIFTHNSSSIKNEVNLVSNWCINTTLTLDPNKNYYSSDHKFYSIAESYVNKRIFSYLDLIENAEEVHVTYSSFYCISSFLELKAKKKICYDRTTGKVTEQYKLK